MSESGTLFNKPIQLNNLSTLSQFHGGLDESWFYLVTVELEQVGAKAILQFFDAVFGIDYEHKTTKEYLRLMRHHMPYKHADFLSYIENTSLLRSSLSRSKKLALAYNKSVNLLLAFRNEHLKMVAINIMKQARQTQSSAKGTGGTNPMVFLKSVRNQNDQVLKRME